jgi:hypothetical protein
MSLRRKEAPMSDTMKGSVAKLADEYGSSRRRTQRVKIAIPVTVRIPKANDAASGVGGSKE